MLKAIQSSPSYTAWKALLCRNVTARYFDIQSKCGDELLSSIFSTPATSMFINPQKDFFDKNPHVESHMTDLLVEMLIKNGNYYFLKPWITFWWWPEIFFANLDTQNSNVMLKIWYMPLISVSVDGCFNIKILWSIFNQQSFENLISVRLYLDVLYSRKGD